METHDRASSAEDSPTPKGTPALLHIGLAVGALGVVFGDIGTSPLYALKGCFAPGHGLPVSDVTVMGLLSLFLWSLVIVIGLKYAWFILRADNKGEGGVFALLALAAPKSSRTIEGIPLALLILAIAGASLLYADGVLTPSISVLSAYEGLEVASPTFARGNALAANPIVLALTIATIAGIFSVQRLGTGVIGRAFGPIMIAWFLVISLLGALEIAHNPAVLEAANPVWIARLVVLHPWATFTALGAVILCITGGEALYADLGHFGRGAIRHAWYFVAMPALILNYFGQGARILTESTRLGESPFIDAASRGVDYNPFYSIVPEWALYPMVVLAAAATIIASQAIITGMFSLTYQAIQLGCLPRFRVVHTSNHGGHVFVPVVNTVAGIGCILIVAMFGTSERLDDAYGLAVAAVMVFTTILYTYVMHHRHGWGAVPCTLFLSTFLSIDLVFLAANLMKIAHGGWLTLLIGAFLMFIMWTWIVGRRVLAQRFARQTLAFDHLLNNLETHPIHRVSGTAVFLTPLEDGVPPTLMHHLKHNKVLHDQVAIMSIKAAPVPVVDAQDQVTVEELRQGFWKITASHGFNQRPDAPELLRLAADEGFKTIEGNTTYFLGRTILTPRGNSRVPAFQKRVFCALAQISANNPTHFGIPPGRMVELGIQIDL
ncbi:MAG: potassium transporter Kup [Phycisphaerales bacterium]|nr:potassium transporter Kup [Phycisphaerales bacterium]